MKKLIVSSILLLSAVSAEAKFANPFGAEIDGAGTSTVVSYMNALISKYKKSYPCPKFVYKQVPASMYSGSENGVNLVLKDAVAFSVSINQLSSTTVKDAPDCLLEIPFILTSLSIIYNLPSDFTMGNADWPGHLNISPADLCTIYTGNPGLTWGGAPGVGLLNRLYNGNQGYAGGSFVKPFARLDSADETELLVKYLTCSNQPLSGTCATFLTAANVTGDPTGPFCPAANIPVNGIRWGLPVTCVQGSDTLANTVIATPGSVGYVMTDVAVAHGFSLPSSGTTGGIPLGIAGLFIHGSASFTSPQQGPLDNPLNYGQPIPALVQAAATDCSGGTLLCTNFAYPIVDAELFVVYATQSVDLITCNIAQFIQFALTEGQKIVLPGFVALPSGCISQNLALLDQMRSAICEPCVPPCNPCLNQTCPLPSCLPCKV